MKNVRLSPKPKIIGITEDGWFVVDGGEVKENSDLPKTKELTYEEY